MGHPRPVSLPPSLSCRDLVTSYVVCVVFNTTNDLTQPKRRQPTICSTLTFMLRHAVIRITCIYGFPFLPPWACIFACLNQPVGFLLSFGFSALLRHCHGTVRVVSRRARRTALSLRRAHKATGVLLQCSTPRRGDPCLGETALAGSTEGQGLGRRKVRPLLTLACTST